MKHTQPDSTLRIVPLLILLGSFILVACGERTSLPDSEKETGSPSETEETKSSPAIRGHETGVKPGSSNEAATDGQRRELERLTLELTGRDLASGKTSLDRDGNPVAATFSDGAKVIFEVSRPVAFITAHGEKTVYKYDEQGNLLQVLLPDGERVVPEVRE